MLAVFCTQRLNVFLQKKFFAGSLVFLVNFQIKIAGQIWSSSTFSDIKNSRKRKLLDRRISDFKRYDLGREKKGFYDFENCWSYNLTPRWNVANFWKNICFRVWCPREKNLNQLVFCKIKFKFQDKWIQWIIDVKLMKNCL